MSGADNRAASPAASDPREHAEEGLAEDIDNPALDLLSLSRAVKARKAEYTRRQSVRVKVGTWNVAGISSTEKDIGKWFVQGQGVCERFSGLKGTQSEQAASTSGSSTMEDPSRKKPFQCSPEEVDLYVLGLQEIVDISSPAETLRPYTDPGPSKRWKEAVQRALPPGTSVGTGLMGYMGNKGAVATRIVLGETTRLVFVNSHLAAGSDKGSLERRNWDASQIASRAKFEPVDADLKSQETIDSIGDEDFTFWFGDLNYRLDDIPGDDVRQVLARHAVNAYDTARMEKKGSGSRRSLNAGSGGNSPPSPIIHDEEAPEPVTDDEIDPHNDPASLQTTISSLVVHDQLQIQQRKGTAFHKGWREGPISFLPTYKYDVGSVATFDSSEKNRGPSWCDRILFRTRRDKLKHEQLDRETEEARKRDKEMQARGLDKAVADDNVLFDYDPEVDGIYGNDGAGDAEEVEYNPEEDQEEDASVSSDDSSPDPIRLDHYVSHQGILSSDHKPLDAIFTLTFDAVNPSLKAKIHQEVVRELDKAENEARPGLTVVVDTHHEDKRTQQDPNTVDFGDVPFDVSVHRSLTIANTGGAEATFTFAGRPSFHDDSKPESPDWLDVRVERAGEGQPESTSSAGSHTLLPGEVANVELTAHVRCIEHVRLLNLRKTKLEEILVLHVDNGRDHFISVCGRWLPTCFGCSVDELTRMPEAGARSLASTDAPIPSKDNTEVRLSAPRELFRLTESISELTERAVAEWSMTKGETEEEAPWAKDPSGTAWPFQPDTWTLQDQHGRASLLESVRESLDINGSLSAIFPPEVSSVHRLEVLAETLLTFLNSLSDGIVTAAVWQKMEQQMIAREKSKAPPRTWEETQAWVLESLAYSPAHSVSFTFVTFMLARVANEIAPVPSIAQSTPETSKLKLSWKHHDDDKHKETKKEEETEESQPKPPTPASAAAFISGGSFRRKNRSQSSSTGSDTILSAGTNNHPAAARRQVVESSLASIFSRVLISASVPTPAKDKERRASDERKRSIIEPFLKMIGVDERGPSGGR
ncbi:Endonuclease/exonuclease/phosphatase [Penicillium argentinense]|uniref:Endonuclease/exonuclease/phosphatase n=1 Tax=Penicillium argentinense TaxID=1131581 RepID=A0A9W9EWG1_9EURO|nr:Endonuclease/exonuclease/phosphatase [Penicillium argentinense]KAJ5089141.1 Endonuclease/exonuclease/phosphatase [Penicillium argentinense]